MSQKWPAWTESVQGGEWRHYTSRITPPFLLLRATRREKVEADSTDEFFLSSHNCSQARLVKLKIARLITCCLSQPSRHTIKKHLFQFIEVT